VAACRRPDSSSAPDVSGDPNGQDAWSFHAAELNAVLARWAVRAKINTRTSRSPKLTRPPTGGLSRPPTKSRQRESMSGRGYPKFRKDRAVDLE
jgi:hypothetical protein